MDLEGKVFLMVINIKDYMLMEILKEMEDIIGNVVLFMMETLNRDFVKEKED